MMRVANRLLLVLTIIGLLTDISTREGIVLRIRGNACKKFNPKYFRNVTCRVRAFNRTTQGMSYEGILRETLTNLKIDITSYRKFGMAYRPNMVKLSENWCDAMNGSSSHYIRLMFSSFSKYGNVIRPCPLAAGRYYVRDMIIDTSNFPQFFPIGDYRMEYSMHTLVNDKWEFVLLLQDFWNVQPMGVMEF